MPAEAALAGGDGIEAETAQVYRTRRDAVLRHLNGTNAVRPVPSSGGMYVMLDIRATGRTGLGFAGDLLDRHGIAVMPGESFGHATAGHVRIALTRPEDELVSAITTVTRYAGELS